MEQTVSAAPAQAQQSPAQPPPSPPPPPPPPLQSSSSPPSPSSSSGAQQAPSSPPSPTLSPHSAPPSPASLPHSAPPSPTSSPHSAPPSPTSSPHSAPPSPASSPHASSPSPASFPHDAPQSPASSPHSAPPSPASSPHASPPSPASLPHDAPQSPASSPHASPPSPASLPHDAPQSPATSPHASPPSSAPFPPPSPASSCIIAFVRSSLERVHQHCGRRDAAVRSLCDECAASLATGDQRRAFTTFFAAITSAAALSSSQKLLPVALSTFDAMFADNMFAAFSSIVQRDDVLELVPDLDAGGVSRGSCSALDAVVDAVAACARRINDENVHLLALKVLKAALLYSNAHIDDVRDDDDDDNDEEGVGEGGGEGARFEFEVDAVHGQALMQCVRSCYHMFLGGREHPTQALAHATLVEMQDTLMQRMDTASQRLAAFNAKHKARQAAARAAPPPPLPPAPCSSADDAKLGKFGSCVVCGEPADHYCLQTRRPVCGVVCKNVQLQREIRSLPAGGFRSRMLCLHLNANMLQNDVFLLFRSLCKLSMKPLAEQPEDVALRSKALALEMLSRLVDRSGHYFRSSKRFVEAVKTFLVQSLLRNCVSPHQKIFNLSLSIFMSLLRRLKSSLKSEVGVFLDRVFLAIAESSNSTQQHKMSVMSVLSQICADSQTLVDLFINFDCDEHALNIFEHMCKVLESAANNVGYMPELRHRALHCLTTVVDSLRKFSDESSANVASPSAASSAATAATAAESEAESGEERDDANAKSSGATTTTTKANVGDVGGVEHGLSRFERRRVEEADFKAGVVKFNLKPPAGLAFLHTKGILNAESPRDVAKFLSSARGLGKEQVGEFLGRHAAFNRDVLYAYVDLLDFTDMHIDDAIRLFLKGFRLPGEAQIIDRMMEKFAERYTTQNPGTFANADVAYVLAFSIIMLNTDAHSIMLKGRKRMTKDEFVRNNRGINPGNDLPVSFMEDIYDRIVTNEIKMSDDAPPPPSSVSGAAPSSSSSSSASAAAAAAAAAAEISSSSLTSLQRRSNYHRETAALVQQSRELLHALQQSGAPSTMVETSPANTHIAQPMFSVIWAAVLATCSVHFQDAAAISADGVRVCLHAYRCCIRLAARFQMDVQRAAFVNSLAKHTLLGTSNAMADKNIEAIRVLLDLACDEGNFLRESWADVLRCISELDRLHMIGSGALSDARFFAEPTSPASAAAAIDASTSASAPDSRNSSALRVAIEASTIDRVFSRSASLHADAIVHFVRELCSVSRQELAASGGEVRVFSLQKLVEITEYNMDRIRLVWSRIWSDIGALLSDAGQHTNVRIAMYAIDSLRQLAHRLLDKDELAQYRFQAQFLQPFALIMRSARATADTREFIVQCASRLVLARAHNVKSGWHSVLSVFTEAAADNTSEPLVQLAFDLISAVVGEYLPMLSADDALDELVRCLLATAFNRFSELSLHAIGLLEQVAQHLADLDQTPPSPPQLPPSSSSKSLPPPSSSSSPSPPPCSDATEPHMHIWFRMLTGLSSLVGDARMEVRARALGVLFHVLRAHGHAFTDATWRMIFSGVLLPIFDDVRCVQSSGRRAALLHDGDDHGGADTSVDADADADGDGDAGDSDEDAAAVDAPLENTWLRTTCLQALSTLVELFIFHFDRINFLLRELVELMCSCVLQRSEALASIGVTCLLRLVSASGSAMTEQHWSMLLASVAEAAPNASPACLRLVLDAVDQLVAQRVYRWWTLEHLHRFFALLQRLHQQCALKRWPQLETADVRTLLALCRSLLDCQHQCDDDDDDAAAAAAADALADLAMKQLLQLADALLTSYVREHTQREERGDQAQLPQSVPQHRPAPEPDVVTSVLHTMTSLKQREQLEAVVAAHRRQLVQLVLSRHRQVRAALRVLLDAMLRANVLPSTPITSLNNT